MTRVEFLEAVEAFLRETGMPDRALGLAAVNETSFVKKLRDGREARERTRERVLAFMDQHRQNCEAGETSTKAATQIGRAHV